MITDIAETDSYAHTTSYTQFTCTCKDTDMAQYSESQQGKHAPNCIYKSVWFNNLMHPGNHQDAQKNPY